jgi:teichuronic acid biosynthesis glycosyltransferase TuaC
MSSWWQSARRALESRCVIRALIVTNMWPTPDRPALGSFVSDQVDALRETGEAEIEVCAFAGGGGDPRAYLRAGARVARRHRTRGVPDVVHAHFGLSAWPALAARGAIHAVTLHGTDIVHPRSRALTLAALPFQQLVATASAPLAALVPRRATHGRAPVILPTGVALDRFAPEDRAESRRALGLDPRPRYLLFAADPGRAEKRADRARALADAVGARLITLGGVPPSEMATWINAADAVLVTSERESFGLAALEALACEVPVLSTPVGVAPDVLAGVPGTLCAAFDLATWSAHLNDLPQRLTGGRERVSPYSSAACARAVIDAWRATLSR